MTVNRGALAPALPLRARQCALRLAEMRRRSGVTQGRVSAIEHAKPGATELRTLAA